MMRQFVTCGLVWTLLLTLSLASYADGQPGAEPPAPPTNAGLEKMKKLAGTWLAADKDGKPTDQVVSVIKGTAGGSAVHETLFPGQPHEMISVYTAEGPDLVPRYNIAPTQQVAGITQPRQRRGAGRPGCSAGRRR